MGRGKLLCWFGIHKMKIIKQNSLRAILGAHLSPYYAADVDCARCGKALIRHANKEEQ